MSIAGSADGAVSDAGFVSEDGRVDLDRAAAAYLMSREQLVTAAGLDPASALSEMRDGRPTPRRLVEMLDVLCRVSTWAGGDVRAMAWFRSVPIPALDGATPETLVAAGRAEAVRGYLDHVALGGFA